MGEIKELIGFGAFEGVSAQALVKVGSYVAVALQIFILLAIIGFVFWFIDMYFFKYNYAVLIKVNRTGGNHYWRFAKGGFFNNRKTKTKEFRIFRFMKRGLSLPIPSADAIEPLIKGKGMILMNKFDTGEYDYFPFKFIPQEATKEFKQRIFPANMQFWSAHKIKENAEKYTFTDWLQKYQGLIFTGTMAFIFLFGMYFMYKANAYSGDAIRDAARVMADIAENQVQRIP